MDGEDQGLLDGSQEVQTLVWTRGCRSSYRNLELLPKNISPQDSASDHIDHTVLVLDQEISFLELDACIRNLKGSKSPGLDGITNEALKALTAPWKSYLLSLYNSILLREEVPSSRAEVILIMIHKKGDRVDPNNYRGIALVNTTTKLFPDILRRRLERWVESNKIPPGSQHGFRRGRCCTDAVFCLLSAVHLQLRLPKREIHAVFVDFKMAFDSIPHNNLWMKFRGVGISSKLTSILISLYRQARLRVRSRGMLWEVFEVKEGVLQGETLSPLLFLLYVVDFEEFFRPRGHVGLNIDGHTDILIQLFADDTVLLADTHIRLRAILATLFNYCCINGLSVNTAKTQILTLKAAGHPKSIDASFTMYGDTPHQRVHSYTYLGVLISSTARANVPALATIGKARIASSSTLAILHRSKCDNWDS